MTLTTFDRERLRTENARLRIEKERLLKALEKARGIYWADAESDVAEAMFMVCNTALAPDIS